MNEAAFEKKLNELVKEIGTVPLPQQRNFISWVKRTSIYHKQLKKGVSSLQESMDYLRVSIKYVLFDLEATRRENDYLKKLLEGKTS